MDWVKEGNEAFQYLADCKVIARKYGLRTWDVMQRADVIGTTNMVTIERYYQDLENRGLPIERNKDNFRKKAA